MILVLAEEELELLVQIHKLGLLVEEQVVRVVMVLLHKLIQHKEVPQLILLVVAVEEECLMVDLGLMEELVVVLMEVMELIHIVME